ncbi:MAG: FAD binding domain-containing protein [Planctomycetes bacterium]|nr:FAD binding domain-containing protein [Planctomycetota bacterium]
MKVLSPRTLEDALRALRDADASTRVLAGGTDLMVELESGRNAPERVVDVWKVAELAYERAEDGGARFGARTTCADLLRSPLAASCADLLVVAAREVGAVQIQNRATLGGNLGTASPAADLNPVLLALGVRVRLASLRGLRELPVDEFLTGYRTTARAADELIESVFVPARPPNETRRFRKVGTRRAQSIAKLVVALCWSLDKRGHVLALRGGAGSLAERSVRLAALERALLGGPLEPARVHAAIAASSAQDIRPRDDVRSTARYRRIVFERVLASLLLGP